MLILFLNLGAQKNILARCWSKSRAEERAMETLESSQCTDLDWLIQRKWQPKCARTRGRFNPAAR